MASGERRPGINFFALLNDNVRKMKYEEKIKWQDRGQRCLPVRVKQDEKHWAK